MNRLNVAFWNVYNLFPVGVVERAPRSQSELDAKLNRLADVINSFFGTGADILGLAEIATEELLVELESRLRDTYHYRWVGQQNNQLTGLAFLFKEAAVSRIVHTDLQMEGLARPRVFMVECRVASTNTDTVVFFINHWKSKLGGGQIDRLASARWIEGQVASYGLRKCIVVLGDFNSEPFETPFNDAHLRTTRFFSSARRGTKLYNPSWRLLGEPDFYESLQEPGYRLSRPKTSHEGSRAFLDQLLVSGGALRGGPLELIESSVCLDWKEGVPDHTYRTKHTIAPARFRFENGIAEGMSDHFPLLASFSVN